MKWAEHAKQWSADHLLSPMAHLLFLFLAYPLLWDPSWCYPQRLFPNFTLVYWWSVHFITLPKCLTDTFNSMCLKNEPLFLSKNHSSLCISHHKQSPRLDPWDGLSPSFLPLLPSYLSLLLLPKHHSITSPSLLPERRFLPFLAWVILSHTWSFYCTVKAFQFHSRAFPQSTAIRLPYSINLNVIFLLRGPWWLPMANYSSWSMSP